MGQPLLLSRAAGAGAFILALVCVILYGRSHGAARTALLTKGGIRMQELAVKHQLRSELQKEKHLLMKELAHDLQQERHDVHRQHLRHEVVDLVTDRTDGFLKGEKGIRNLFDDVPQDRSRLVPKAKANKIFSKAVSAQHKAPHQMTQVQKAILAAQAAEQIGYLRSGDDLPGMPIQLYEGTTAKGIHYDVRGQCEGACLNDVKCKGYTYLTETGKCYLKSKLRPGLDKAKACHSTSQGDSCWYFGVISKSHG